MSSKHKDDEPQDTPHPADDAGRDDAGTQANRDGVIQEGDKPPDGEGKGNG